MATWDSSTNHEPSARSHGELAPAIDGHWQVGHRRGCLIGRIYIAEKGLEDVIEQIDFEPPVAEKFNTPEYLAKNPAGKIPLLELDDGTCGINDGGHAAGGRFADRTSGSPPGPRIRARTSWGPSLV